MSVQAQHAMHEPLRWKVHFHVDKYSDDQAGLLGLASPTGDDFELARIRPYAVTDTPGNLLTTAGLNRLTSLLIGAGGQALTNTACRIGVGNSATAEAVGNTDLSAAAGSANRQFKVMDATYPTQANGVVTLRSSFATGEANFVWAEWGVDVGTPTVTDGTTVAALLFNRKVQAQGTKVSGVWVATATVTVA